MVVRDPVDRASRHSRRCPHHSQGCGRGDIAEQPSTHREEGGRSLQPNRVEVVAVVPACARAGDGHGACQCNGTPGCPRTRQPATKKTPPYIIRFTVCIGTYNHTNPLGCPTVYSRFEKAARTVWLQSGRAGSTQRCSMRCCQGGQRTPTEMMPGKQASCPSGARRACHRRPHELVALG